MSQAYYDDYWTFTEGLPDPWVSQRLGEFLLPGVRCLDVGCGDGQAAVAWMNGRGSEYVGVDVSEEAVARARSIGLDARHIEDASALPFEPNSFDVVVCLEVLEHLFAPAEAATEILRVLKPGGVLVATVPNAAYWARRIELGLLGRWKPMGNPDSLEYPWRDPHIRFFTAGALTRMLVRVGFERPTIGGHMGSVGGHLPWNRKNHLRKPPSRIYGFLQRKRPSFFGFRLHAIARKPEATSA